MDSWTPATRPLQRVPRPGSGRLPPLPLENASSFLGECSRGQRPLLSPGRRVSEALVTGTDPPHPLSPDHRRWRHPWEVPSLAKSAPERMPVSPPPLPQPLYSYGRSLLPQPAGREAVQLGSEGVAAAVRLVAAVPCSRPTCSAVPDDAALAGMGQDALVELAESVGITEALDRDALLVRLAVERSGFVADQLTTRYGSLPHAVEDVGVHGDTEVVLCDSRATLVIAPEYALGRWSAAAAQGRLRTVRYPLEQDDPLGVREGARVMITRGDNSGVEAVVRSSAAVDSSDRIGSRWGVDLKIDGRDAAAGDWVVGAALRPLSPRPKEPPVVTEERPPEADVKRAEDVLAGIMSDQMEQPGVNRTNAGRAEVREAAEERASELRSLGYAEEGDAILDALAVVARAAECSELTMRQARDLAESADVVLLSFADFAAEVGRVRELVGCGAIDPVDNLATPLLRTRFHRLIVDFGDGVSSSESRDAADLSRAVAAVHRWKVSRSNLDQFAVLSPQQRRVGDRHPPGMALEVETAMREQRLVVSDMLLRELKPVAASELAARIKIVEAAARGVAALAPLLCERNAHVSAVRRCRWRPSSGSTAAWIDRMRAQEGKVRLRPAVDGWWGKFECVRSEELLPWRLLDQAGRGKQEMAGIEAERRAEMWRMRAEELFTLVGVRQETRDRNALTRKALIMLSTIGAEGSYIGHHLVWRRELLQQDKVERSRLQKKRLADCANAELAWWDRVTRQMVAWLNVQRRERLALERSEGDQRDSHVNAKEQSHRDRMLLLKRLCLQRWDIEWTAMGEMDSEVASEHVPRQQLAVTEMNHRESSRRAEQTRECRGELLSIMWRRRLEREELTEGDFRGRWHGADSVSFSESHARSGAVSEFELFLERLQLHDEVRSDRTDGLRVLSLYEGVQRAEAAGRGDVRCGEEDVRAGIAESERERRERIIHWYLTYVYRPAWNGWLQRADRERARERAARAVLERDFRTVLHSLFGLHPAGYQPEPKWVAKAIVTAATVSGNPTAAHSLGSAAEKAHRTFRDEGLDLAPGCWLPARGFKPQLFTRVTAEEHIARRRVASQQVAARDAVRAAARQPTLRRLSSAAQRPPSAPKRQPSVVR